MSGNRNQGSKWLRPTTRARLYARDGLVCLWCLTPVVPKETATVDHFLPRVLGGTNAHDNLFTACWTCNSERATSPALLYAAEKDRFGALDRIIEHLGKPLPKAA